MSGVGPSRPMPPTRIVVRSRGNSKHHLTCVSVQSVANDQTAPDPLTRGAADQLLGCQLPRSTAPKNSCTIALKAAGSSKLTACPVRGTTQRPALEIILLRYKLGCRQ